MVSEVASHFGYNEKYLSHLFTNLSRTSMKSRNSSATRMRILS